MVSRGALVELGEEQLPLHGRGLYFELQRDLAHRERGDAGADE